LHHITHICYITKLKLFDTIHNEVSDVGFCFSSDVITKEEAIAMLYSMQAGKEEREEQMKKIGYPAYTTQAGNHILL
jgi:L-fuconate dehydratase